MDVTESTSGGSMTCFSLSKPWVVPLVPLSYSTREVVMMSTLSGSCCCCVDGEDFFARDRMSGMSHVQ